MLTARSVIVAVFTIAVLSVIGVVLELAQPPDSGGLAHDSYGTRAYGQRALVELLEELNVPVERGLVPPSALVHRDVCLVFISPHPNLMNLEPDHLRRVGQWMREGGTVVIAPATDEVAGSPSGFQARWSPYAEERSALEELGLGGVALVPVPGPGSAATSPPATVSPPSAANGTGAWPWSSARGRPSPRTAIDVGADGELAALGDHVLSLEVPRAALQVIDRESSTTPAGRVFWPTAGAMEHTLVGLYPVGKGCAIVVSEPALLINLSVARQDNAVLAAHLLARAGHPVVFDEFYHGLTVRGNPVYLVTQHPYGLVAALLLAASAIWVWRGLISLGPPLAERKVRRRTLREYVEAMGNVFVRGDCGAFALHELRNGVVWALRKRLHLSARQETVDDIARVLARRDPEEAERLRRTMAEVDALLREGPRPRAGPIVRAARKVAGHL